MNFDRVAKPYQHMEHLVFGRALKRCRTTLLPHVTPPGRALLIGEGDGHFLHSFLLHYPRAEVDVIEPSAALISLTQHRTSAPRNVRFHQESALTTHLTGPYDLVVTHFVLDVFTAAEVAHLARAIHCIAPKGAWWISEFHSSGTLSRSVIAAMYAFFRLAAGVRVNEIPPYAKVLEQHGMRRILQHQGWNGFFRSELWSVPPATYSPTPSGNR